MSDAERRPDLLESLLGLCEPDDMGAAPAAAPEVAAPEAERASAAAAPGADVATVVAGLQHPDPSKRSGALALLVNGDPDLRSLARLGLADIDDQVRAQATAVVASLGTGSLPELVTQLRDDAYPRTRQVALAGVLALVTSRLDHEDLVGMLSALEATNEPVAPDVAVALRQLGDRIGLDHLSPWRPRFPRATALLLDPNEVLATTDPAPAPPEAPVTTPEPLPAPAVSASTPAGDEQEQEPVAPVSSVVVAGDRGAAVITSLAVALGDEIEAVRDRATRALRQLDRGSVVGWARRHLQSGTQREAQLAVDVARVLVLTEASAEVLGRAAEQPPEDNPYLDALRVWGEDPSVTIDHVKQVAPSRRHDALRAAWRLHGDGIVPFVDDLLNDSAGPVRTAALEILGHRGDQAVADVALRVLAADSSPSVRTTAVKLLGRAAGPERVQALRRALADPDPDVRATGVEVLLQAAATTGTDAADAEAVGLLLQALSDAEEWVWRSAVEQLAALANAVPGLVWTALRNGPRRQQDELFVLLEVRRPERLGHIALDKLGSRDIDDRVLAVRLIGLIGSTDGVQRVIQALNDPSPTVRRAAAHELSGLPSPEAVPALTNALLDPDHGVRQEAVAALGVIDDDEVIPALVGALTDPDDDVRRRAASVIARWSSPSVARAIVSFLTRAQLDESAIDLLVGMGPAAIDPLMDAIVAADEDLVPTLGLLLHRVVGLDALLEQARTLDPQARLRAVEGIGAIGGDRSLESLILSLGDPHIPVRIAAIKGLARYDDPRALNAIRAVRTMDPVAEVVAAADEVLLGPDAPPPADINLTDDDALGPERATASTIPPPDDPLV